MLEDKKKYMQVFFTNNLAILLFVCASLLTTNLIADEKNTHRQIYIPNGQVLSNLVKVYTTDNISRKMRPCLRIISMEETKPSSDKYPEECKNSTDSYFLPIEMTENSVFKSQGVARTGTLMLFNLSTLKSAIYLPGTRFQYALYWEDDKSLQLLIGADTAYLGSSQKSLIMALVSILSILLLLTLLSEKIKNSSQENQFKIRLLYFVSNKSGALMLPLVQMAIWTIAIGSVVLGFALVGLESTQLPESLVALMGLSAITGVAGHWQSKQIDKKLNKKMGDLPEVNPETSADKTHPVYAMLCIRSSDGKCYPSLAKAQMLFWTLITVGIFMYKSIAEGALWEVPNELVLLMGISQAGFLGREQLEVKEADNNKQDATRT